MRGLEGVVESRSVLSVGIKRFAYSLSFYETYYSIQCIRDSGLCERCVRMGLQCTGLFLKGKSSSRTAVPPRAKRLIRKNANVEGALVLVPKRKVAELIEIAKDFRSLTDDNANADLG